MSNRALAFVTCLALFALAIADGTCDVATGGTCKMGLCYSWRHAECEGNAQQCKCAKGSCSHNGECVANGGCSRVTEGSCMSGRCQSWRNAHCSPFPHFPTPCLHAALKFMLAAFLAVVLLIAGSCVCVVKNEIALPVGVPLAVVALILAIWSIVLMGHVGPICLAVGVMDDKGYHLPSHGSAANDMIGSAPAAWPLPLQLGSWSARMCECADDECNVNGECVKDGCRKFTGENCVFSCGGGAKCVVEMGSAKCLCGEGECVEDGKCVPKKSSWPLLLESNATVPLEAAAAAPASFGYAWLLGACASMLALFGALAAGYAPAWRRQSEADLEATVAPAAPYLAMD